jgi:aminoglycoside phosphotransferase family enzyme
VGSLVYKIKRPVATGFVDYSSLDRAFVIESPRN